MGGNGLYTRQRRFFHDCQQTYNWVIPDGVTKVWAFVIGGGGGGSLAWSSNNQDRQGAAGGAGGGYASGTISGLTPGNTITVTVGKPGRGQTRDYSGSAGTASSFGSYLTGNGGTNGTTHSYGAAGADGSSAWGTGGSASTSGVSDAYTSPGGGISPQPNSDRLGYYTTAAGGGASSGSPFGRGSNRPHFMKRAANGGAGWSTGNMKNQPWYAYITTYENQMQEGSLGGDGSHSMAQVMHRNGNNEGSNCTRGGNGMTAIGGDAYFGLMQTTQQNASFKERCGENANPNWWFPWEIDGGGGGSTAAQISTNWTSTGDTYGWKRGIAGNGGPGAGGGGAFFNRQDYNMAYTLHGGDGGFGGGGGGAYAWYYTYTHQQICSSSGGNGGIGGGGGSCHGAATQNSQTWQSGRGGNGGRGIVAVYW